MQWCRIWDLSECGKRCCCFECGKRNDCVERCPRNCVEQDCKFLINEEKILEQSRTQAYNNSK